MIVTSFFVILKKTIIIPRHSTRKTAISWMRNHVQKLRHNRLHREVMDEDDSLEDYYLLTQEHKLKRMKYSRYLFRDRHYRKRSKFNLEDCILTTCLSPFQKKNWSCKVQRCQVLRWQE
jgi:hypothetical protein